MIGVSYSINNTPDKRVIPDLLTTQITAAGFPSAPLSVEIRPDSTFIVWFATLFDPSFQKPLDEIVAAHRADLDVYRQRKFAEIDANTDKIIDQGFEYRGLRFSETLEAQSRGLGMDQNRNDPLFTYPVYWNSIDNLSAATLSTPDEVHAFVLTGIGYYRQAIDSGTALKAQVRAAQTPEEVEGITDKRLWPQAAAPATDLAFGSYTGLQVLHLSTVTPSASIYYTLDGTSPTPSSTPYGGAPVAVTASLTLQAIAVAPGYRDSPLLSGTYTIS